MFSSSQILFELHNLIPPPTDRVTFIGCHCYILSCLHVVFGQVSGDILKVTDFGLSSNLTLILYFLKLQPQALVLATNN